MASNTNESAASSSTAGTRAPAGDSHPFPRPPRMGIREEFGSSPPAVVGIGRRPLNYTGSEGWASRIGYRTLYGAAVGTGAGLVMGAAAANGRGASHVTKWMRIMGTNCALVTLCFCGSQELVREIRAAEPDDPANCVLGGLLSGGLLGRIQGGSSRILPFALLFAGLGTGLQFGVNELKEYRLRQYLEKSALGDPADLFPESEGDSSSAAGASVKGGGGGAGAGAAGGTGDGEGSSWKLPEWFPIQVLDEKAAAERKAKQEEEFRGRVQGLQKGERP